MKDLKAIAYNCKKATYLVEKRQIARLTFREAFELRVHLIGCDVCKLYVKQSEKINEMIKQLLRTNGHAIQLDERFKKVLQDQIDDHLNKK
jgi:ribosomal protein S3AE